MTNLRKKLIALALMATAFTFSASAAYSVVKTEFRSAWLTTVWSIDWPTAGASAAYQQAEMDELLDSLAANNFNAVNFQVRSMCDAMYKSSCEPWSSYLTGTRGQVPDYDPLQYVVEGCHKRGMECHAWVNPYRWSSGTDWSTQTEVDSILYHSGHLLSYNGTTILDPAQQWTIDRIVQVCREIVTGYDVDGILYDDYFYPSGIPSTSSAGDYQEWKNSGTSLSIGDWRRANVNKMVKAVYDMIQTEKPYVRFGISPAGVACSSSTVAKKYGIDPCPGSDWQYNGIFSDPIAWYSEQSVDFISPQVYWTIGYSAADYGKITPWWGKVAEKFGRHVYISHSITSLTGASQGENAPALDASGPNNTSYDEFVTEVEMNRSTNYQDAPGSIYYSAKYLYALGAKESFAHYLKRTVYTTPALPPAMTWKTASDPGKVKNVEKVAFNLSWEGLDNVRYTVYAVPESMAAADFGKEVKYLLGMTYSTTFAIPESCRYGYKYAVCVLDRYGNEWEPEWISTKSQSLDKPQLVSPAEGERVNDPYEFTWKPVDGATEYTLAIASDPAFKQVTHSIATTDTVVASSQLENMESDVVQYWRVNACASGYNDGVSFVRAFTPHRLEVTYPADGMQDVENDPTVKWTNTGTDNVKLEIAKNTDFAESNIVFSTTTTENKAAVPLYLLHSGTHYYARIIVNGDTSKVNAFTTIYRESVAPKFVLPATNGQTLNSNQHLEVERQVAAENLVIEISNSETTWGRTRFVETMKNYQNATTLCLGALKVNAALMTDGETYYARAKSQYIDSGGTLRTTDYSDVISFVYKKVNPIGDVNGDGVVNTSDITALIAIILSPL